jgi:hypothetical protein
MATEGFSAMLRSRFSRAASPRFGFSSIVT